MVGHIPQILEVTFTNKQLCISTQIFSDLDCADRADILIIMRILLSSRKNKNSVFETIVYHAE